MNQKLNAWLCKHFDREKIKTDEFGGNERTIPRKGYVTLWDIIKIAILEPLFAFLIVVGIAFVAIVIPNLFVPTHPATYYNSEFWTAMIYGVGFWAIIASLYLTYKTLAWITSYKVAVCPLAEKKPKEYDEDIPASEKEKRKHLKEAEAKMFEDILKEEN